MKYLVIVSTLFVIGSLLGWVTELFFRRFVSQKKWMNPGFLTGPYLPIYGFGVAVLYAVSNIPLKIDNQVVDIIIRIIIIGVGMTLIEFIAGLIFIKGCGIKLWDYSNRKGNIMGIILVLGISWISENLIYTYFIGAVIGAMIVDFAYSIHLATKLKQFKELQNLRFEEFKKELKRRINDLKSKLDK